MTLLPGFPLARSIVADCLGLSCTAKDRLQQSVDADDGWDDMAAKTEVYERNDGRWGFRLKQPDGHVVTGSEEGYESKVAAYAAAGAVHGALESAEATEAAMAAGSVGVLSDFLDMLVQAGALNPSTAQSYRTAVKAVRTVTDYWPGGDVRGLDVDAVCVTFAVRQKDLSDQTVETYQTRFRKAVEMYRQWLDDPASVQVPATREPVVMGTGGGKTALMLSALRWLNDHPEPGAAHLAAVQAYLATAEVGYGVDLPQRVRYPFPLSDGQFAQLELPHRISQADAERLSAFVLTLATDSAPADG